MGAPAKKKNFIKLTEVISSAPENYGFVVQCNSPVGFHEPETLEAVKSLKGIKGEKKNHLVGIIAVEGGIF